MKSRSEVWLRALNEIGAQCSVSTTHDAETLVRRTARGEEVFLRLTLPTFAKDLERSLALGYIPTSAFKGFPRQNRPLIVFNDHGNQSTGGEIPSTARGGNPKFLGGFLDLVFDDTVMLSADEHRSLHGDWVQAMAGASDKERRTYSAWLGEYRPPVLRSFMDKEELRVMVNAVKAVRQLCLMFGKEKELCSDSRVDAAVTSFVEVDRQLDLPF